MSNSNPYAQLFVGAVVLLLAGCGSSDTPSVKSATINPGAACKSPQKTVWFVWPIYRWPPGKDFYH